MASKVLLACLVLLLVAFVHGANFRHIDKREPEFKRMLYRFRQQKRGVCIDVRRSDECLDMTLRDPTYCKAHEGTMRQFCSKTCKFCVYECKDEYDPEFCKVVSKCGSFCQINRNKLAEKYCKKTCNLCDVSGKFPSPDKTKECKDLLEPGRCLTEIAIRKNLGLDIKELCDLQYMRNKCRESCNRCNKDLNEIEVMSDLAEIIHSLDS